jgi:hypothetical protein
MGTGVAPVKVVIAPRAIGAIGVLPGQARIGVVAGVLVVVLRATQGLAAVLPAVYATVVAVLALLALSGRPETASSELV